MRAKVRAQQLSPKKLGRVPFDMRPRLDHRSEFSYGAVAAN
jgi:hypothetical protein